MDRLHLFLMVTAFAVATSGTTAQPYGTDLYIANAWNPPAVVGDVLRLDTSGKLYTVIVWSQFPTASYPNMLLMDNNNRDLVVMEPTQLRIWNMTRYTPLTTIPGPSGVYMSWINSLATGDFLVAGGPHLAILPRNGSPATTIATGAPLFNIHCAVVDLATGGYILGELSMKNLLRLAPNGAFLGSMHIGVSPFCLAQDHHTGSLIVGTGIGIGRGGEVITIDPTGLPNVINAAAGNANAVAFDRGHGRGEIVVGTDPVFRMDMRGVVFTTHPGIPNTMNAGICFDRSRNVVSVKVGSPNHYQINLDIPAQPTRSYVLGLSLTGYRPGIRVDSRWVQLTPDPVLFLTLQGQLPFFRKNIGSLDASGRASATLDLRSFGHLLSGIRVWFAAVTIDPNAPSQIGVITKPIIMILE